MAKPKTKKLNLSKPFKTNNRFSWKKGLVVIGLFAIAGTLLLQTTFASSYETYYWDSPNIIHVPGCGYPVESYPFKDHYVFADAQLANCTLWFGPKVSKNISNPSGIGMHVCFTVIMPKSDFQIYYFDVSYNDGNNVLVSRALTGNTWINNWMGNHTDGSVVTDSWGNAAVGNLCFNVRMNRGYYRNIEFRAKLQELVERARPFNRPYIPLQIYAVSTTYN